MGQRMAGGVVVLDSVADRNEYILIVSLYFLSATVFL